MRLKTEREQVKGRNIEIKAWNLAGLHIYMRWTFSGMERTGWLKHVKEPHQHENINADKNVDLLLGRV